MHFCHYSRYCTSSLFYGFPLMSWWIVSKIHYCHYLCLKKQKLVWFLKLSVRIKLFLKLTALCIVSFGDNFGFISVMFRRVHWGTCYVWTRFRIRCCVNETESWEERWLLCLKWKQVLDYKWPRCWCISGKMYVLIINGYLWAKTFIGQ